MDVYQVAELLKIEVNDINQLIAHGKIKRPNRLNNKWELNETNIEEIKKLPKDVLPSTQKLFRQKAFWSKKLDGVTIPASVIALTRAMIDDSNTDNTNFIVDMYSKEFCAYYDQIDPNWLGERGSRIIKKLYEACKTKVELYEALALVEKKELISTRQMAAVCGCTPTDIRNLWKERRIAPTTQSYAGALLFRLDNLQIETIKNHLAGKSELPAHKFSARRDIIHYEVTE